MRWPSPRVSGALLAFVETGSGSLGVALGGLERTVEVDRQPAPCEPDEGGRDRTRWCRLRFVMPSRSRRFHNGFETRRSAVIGEWPTANSPWRKYSPACAPHADRPACGRQVGPKSCEKPPRKEGEGGDAHSAIVDAARRREAALPPIEARRLLPRAASTATRVRAASGISDEFAGAARTRRPYPCSFARVGARSVAYPLWYVSDLPAAGRRATPSGGLHGRGGPVPVAHVAEAGWRRFKDAAVS